MNGLILNAAVETYMNDLLPKRDAVLAEMEKLAKRRDIPIIGPACARILYMMAKLTKARRVFEMGSAIGYSTIWLARAVGPQGRVYYTDGDASNARTAREFLARAGVERRVEVLVGDALKLSSRRRASSISFSSTWTSINIRKRFAGRCLACEAADL